MKAFTLSSTATSVTERSDESLRAYLNMVSKTHPLSIDEEKTLFTRIADGDANAYDELIKSNLRFVISIAKGYQNRGLSLADLIEEGNTGLIEAVSHFDSKNNVRFATYAVWYIRRNIISALNAYAGNIYVPGNVASLAVKVKALQSQFEQKNERRASIAELAAALGESTVKIAEALEAISRTSSLDDPFSGDDDSDGVIGDAIYDREQASVDSTLDTEDLAVNINKLLAKALNPRDCVIVKKLFGIGCQKESTAEIALKTGLTTVRINQIRNSSIEKLRRCEGIKELAQYLV